MASAETWSHLPLYRDAGVRMSATTSSFGDNPPLVDARPSPAFNGIGDIEIAGRRYIKPERLAAILSVSVRTLARWNASGIGPPKISIGKTVLFDLAKLPDWLAARETHPTRNRRS
jgi:hypothetical protein